MYENQDDCIKLQTSLNAEENGTILLSVGYGKLGDVPLSGIQILRK